MAAATEAQQRARISLKTIRLMLGDLAEVAAEWDCLDGGEQESWSLDWSNEMSGLERLARQAGAGLLTPSQYVRYQELLRKLREGLPLVQRLGLYRPEVPLLEAELPRSA